MQALSDTGEKENLNYLFKEYLQGSLDRKKMEGKLFLYIKAHPRQFSVSLLDIDSRDDFLSWIYPRLSRAIDRYSDQGSCFDAYITAMVRLSVKEYYFKKKEYKIIEKTWWSAKAQEMEVMEEEPEYFDIKPVQKKVSNPRQVLMLLLKSYYFLSDSHLERLAPAVGLEKEELFRMVDKLRVVRVQREESINGLKERIHGQFYRCLVFEKRMQASSVYSAHWFRMKRCLETARKRLASMRRRLNTMRIEASNEQVAGIMGVAKGTIDSNLHEVWKRNGGQKPQSADTIP